MSYYRQGPIRPPGSGVGIGVPPFTPVVRALVIACVATWLGQVLCRSVFGWDLAQGLGVVPASVVRGAIWQLVTYAFLHSVSDPFHLMFNMLMLWMFGGEIEQYLGRRRFLTHLLVSAVGGGIAATLLGLAAAGFRSDPAISGIPTIGASGALFGLFVAYGILFGNRVIYFMGFLPMRARTMTWILVALNSLYLLSASGSGVSYIAHLGGALAGYIHIRRAWNLGQFFGDLRWKLRRRRFRVMPPRDSDDRWIH